MKGVLMTLYKQAVNFFLVMLITTTSMYAVVQYRLEDFEKEGGKTSAGLVFVDGNPFLKAGLSPDFNLGPIALGLDLNLYVPLKGDSPSLSDLSPVVLRRIGYTHKDQWGFEWGGLRGVNYGYGLLMDNYNSDSGGSSEFSTEKAGVKGFAKVMGVRLDGMWTVSNITAGRLSYELDLGIPLVAGATVIQDADGMNYSPDGGTTTITAPVKRGIAADIGIPIGGELFALYVEHARLLNENDTLSDANAGSAAGFRGNLFQQVDYRFEYRILEAGFIPGYFNNTYEALGFDNANLPTSSFNGYLGTISTAIMDDYVKFGLEYQHLEGLDPMLTAAAGWKEISNTVGVINYTQAFSNGSKPVAEAEILYKTGGTMDYIVKIKRVYTTVDEYTESYGVGFRFNMDKLMPGIPFLS